MLTKAVPKNKNHSQRTRTRLGDIVYVRYYDAVLFKDSINSNQMKPFVRETIGWLDYEDSDYIRLVWERYAEPILSEESRIRTTGLALRKTDIVEMKSIPLQNSSRGFLSSSKALNSNRRVGAKESTAKNSTQ